MKLPFRLLGLPAVCVCLQALIEWVAFGVPGLATAATALLVIVMGGVLWLHAARGSLTVLLVSTIVIVVLAGCAAWGGRVAWWVTTHPKLTSPRVDSFFVLATMAAMFLVPAFALQRAAVAAGLRRFGSALRVLMMTAWSVALLVLAGEAVFRLTGNLGRNNWEVYDSHWSHKPGATFRWRGQFGQPREFDVMIRNNRFGFHDVEWAEPKPPGVRRVMLLGDSYVQGHQVPLDQTTHKLMQQQLAGTAAGIEVLGLGYSGYGTFQEEKMLDETGFRLSPDLVVLCFLPGNDVRDSSEELRKRENSDRDFTLNNGRLYRLIRYYRLRFPGHALWAADRQLAIARRRGAPAQDFHVFTSTPADEAWACGWKIVEASVLAIEKKCRERGARLAVVSLSCRQQILAWAAECDASQKPALAALTAAWPVLPDNAWDFTAPDRRMESFCRSNGIPVLVLSREFAKLTDGERSALHLAADGHWTRAGHEHAAREILGFIAREKLIPPAS